MPSTTYHDYVSVDSPEWQMKRLAAIARAGGICEVCYRMPATQAHHVSYARLERERPEDLLAICQDCHRQVHRRYPPRKSTAACPDGPQTMLFDIESAG